MKSLETVTAKDIMTSKLVSLSPDDSLENIDDLMVEKKIHHLPVIDDKGTCVGIISQSDLYWLETRDSKFGIVDRSEKNDRFLSALRAKEIMTKNPVKVSSDTSLDDIIDLFIANKFHALIVSDDNITKGIIASIDLIKLLKSR